MDRYDESRSVVEETERVAPDDKRSGDILGLGGAVIPKSPGDPSASDDPKSKARQRARARRGDSGG